MASRPGAAFVGVSPGLRVDTDTSWARRETDATTDVDIGLRHDVPRRVRAEQKESKQASKRASTKRDDSEAGKERYKIRHPQNTRPERDSNRILDFQIDSIVADTVSVATTRRFPNRDCAT